ncbi:MAG: NAD(P)/FAD-dependent oxidoreductase, partial [Deltaproteobacteria bacterium]|nr:NAD(P)/FAD-dependent oxidoreductase [Deltaproteobacteria bacterium]
GIAGYDLCPTVQRQAAEYGAEFERAEVQALDPAGQFWNVVTSEERHVAKAVVVATGSTLKSLKVPGEEKLFGRGVSHCASCDGPLYRGNAVGVVGGGDSALQEALTLANYADQVHILNRGERFSAQHCYQERLSGNANIIIRHQTYVEEILGEDVVTGVRIHDLAAGDSTEMKLSGLFIYVGFQPNTGFLRNIIELSDTGHVSTDAWMRTEKPGLYAVGDIRHDTPAQAITSAGEGATAAIAAYRYIKETFF